MNLEEKEQKFLNFIHDCVSNQNMSYIEAVCEYCEEHGLEPQSVIKLIPKTVQSKIEAEANSLNLIEKDKDSQKLPIDK